MERIKFVYIIDSEESIIKEKLNLEYLDLFSHASSHNFICLNKLRNSFNVYQHILNYYNIDSTTPVLQLAINEIDRWPLEKEMISDKMCPWVFFSRGNFFNEILEVVSKSSNKLLDLNKYLIAIKKLNFILDVNSADDCLKCFKFFISLIKNTFSDNYELMSEFLLVFSTSIYIVEDIFCILPVDELKFLLKCARKQKINFSGIWHSNEQSSFNLFYTMSSKSYDNFIVVLDMGAKNVYSIDVYEKLFRESEWTIRFNVNEFWRKNESTRRDFLILQVLFLYEDSKHEDYVQMTENPLVALWDIISDPHLSETEFLIFGSVYPEICKTFFKDCWLWYNRHLPFTRNSCSSFIKPRSLKHLARCAIRRNLVVNFLTPSDVDWTGSIPVELHDYLITISPIDPCSA